MHLTFVGRIQITGLIEVRLDPQSGAVKRRWVVFRIKTDLGGEWGVQQVLHRFLAFWDTFTVEFKRLVPHLLSSKIDEQLLLHLVDLILERFCQNVFPIRVIQLLRNVINFKPIFGVNRDTVDSKKAVLLVVFLQAQKRERDLGRIWWEFNVED